jgi:GT2 family glycosyltransferase
MLKKMRLGSPACGLRVGQLAARDGALRVAILLTSHNRANCTLQCLRALESQEFRAGVVVFIFLVDDGSTDGTAEQVQEHFRTVRVIRGNGQLYWCGGMSVAFAEAINGDFDYFVFINDDTMLFSDAIQSLIDTSVLLAGDAIRKPIVVGATLNPSRNEVTYGGWVRTRGWNRLKLRKLPYSIHPQSCDTFNGNCVLIPRHVAQTTGNLDKAFTHGMGDMDYGFRARNLGHALWVAGGAVGICELNQGKGLWTDPTLRLRDRWAQLLGPKGLPVQEWRVFTRRHAGPLWLIAWLQPYIQFWIKGLFFKVRFALSTGVIPKL